MVHRRELEGQELVFGNQGALFRNALTMWDHDTGSIWAQPTGEALLGPRKGATLELLPSQLTTWGEWVADHPDTLALDAQGGATIFQLDQTVIAVEFDPKGVGYSVPQVREVGVVNDVVGGVELAVYVEDQRWTVFSRKFDDVVVELELRDEGLVDVRTGSVFDPVSGQGRSGPLRGEVLGRLPAFTIFPKDFPSFFPEGRIWPE